MLQQCVKLNCCVPAGSQLRRAITLFFVWDVNLKKLVHPTVRLSLAADSTPCRGCFCILNMLLRILKHQLCALALNCAYDPECDPNVLKSAMFLIVSTLQRGLSHRFPAMLLKWVYKLSFQPGSLDRPRIQAWMPEFRWKTGKAGQSVPPTLPIPVPARICFGILSALQKRLPFSFEFYGAEVGL